MPTANVPNEGPSLQVECCRGELLPVYMSALQDRRLCILQLGGIARLRKISRI